ncbi:MAG: hypothetical protein AAF039_17475 [Bacteroidota bacterium]
MRRVIIDYKRLDREIASLLIELYPHGYGDDDIIILKKPNGELIEAVEVKTADTIYLVKISQSLSNFISNFEENIEKELESGSKSKETADVHPELESGYDLEADDLE